MKTNKIGRPRNPNSANYKLVEGLFGKYISQKDMSKAQLKQYKSSLKMFA